MAKIDNLGIQEFPPSGVLLDWNEAKRLAYMKGIDDTLIALTNQITKTNPKDLSTFVDSILKFIEGYYQ